MIAEDDCIELKELRACRRQKIDRSRFAVRMVWCLHVHDALILRRLQFREMSVNQRRFIRFIGVDMEKRSVNSRHKQSGYRADPRTIDA